MLRLPGLDAARCAAAGAVVLSHAWEPWMDASPFAGPLGSFLGFHVPLFFAVAFYLQTESTGGRPFRDRALRLLKPYLFYTVLYLSIRAALYWKQGRVDEFHGLWRNLLPTLATGSAAVHLYFLPALLLGQWAVHQAKPRIPRLSPWAKIGGVLAGIAVSLFLQFSPPVLFSGFWIQWVEWLLQGVCFFLMLSLLHLQPENEVTWRLPVIAALWLFINLAASPLPALPQLLVRGLSGLWLALALNPLLLPHADRLAKAGTFFLPVYLLHPIFIEGLQLAKLDRTLLPFLGPVPSLLAMGTTALALTVAAIFVLRKISAFRSWTALD
jgi:fucose 4-O-acetylase-like acetyltransferase